MKEVSKVRLVRCPKCENLLPEHPDYSVYQCGGCGAVLRAKKSDLLEDKVMETSHEERGRRVSEKLDVNVGLCSVSGSEMGSNGIEPGRTFRRNNNENTVLDGISSTGVVSREVLEDVDLFRREKERSNLGVDHDRKMRFTQDGHQPLSNGPNDNCIPANANHDLKSDGADYVKLNRENELEEDQPSVGPLRSRANGDQGGFFRNSSTLLHSRSSSVAGQGRFANFPRPDVGSSSYVGSSDYRYGERMRYADGSDELARVKNLENDRAELLRKLDELADQLTRSCDAGETPKERIHVDPHIPPDDTHDSFLRGATEFSYGVNSQPHAADGHVSAAQYVTHSYGFGPYMDGHGIPLQKPYHARNFAHEYGGFADSNLPQMLRRPSYRGPNLYHEGSCYEHLPGHYMNFKQDLFMPCQHENFFHQPACSCLHCINVNQQVASKNQTSVMASRNAHHEYTNRNVYQRMNPLIYDHQGYISDGSNLLPPKSRDRKVLTRSSSDLDRETSGFGYSRLKNMVVTKGGSRLFRPVAGGAPFLTCCNCYELLKLPRNLMSIKRAQRKLKCGACSSVLMFELDGKGIAISGPVKSEQVSLKVATPTRDMQDENFQSSQAYQDYGVTSNYDDYDNFNYNFQFADTKPFPSSGDQKLNFGQSEMRHDPNSSTSSSSADEVSPDSVIVRNEACSAEVVKDEMCLPLPDAPSQESPDHSSEEVMHIYGHGNKSKRIDQDVNDQDGRSSQHWPKESTVATEMDVSYKDHLGIAHDSAETIKKEDLPRINKGGESFFVGLIKRRFGDFSRSSKNVESVKLYVSVNGLCIPDRVVKKAEKLAGPIKSGEFWYDFRAGFWGVMGHPCLGIIPPNIEEFNCPMPVKCAGGNTEVFVNGRELHQKDLHLLASRGLPTTRNKSYLIEISGRVMDEGTGEELDGLGKLAPTVDRVKHGFGMKVRKTLVEQDP